MQKIKFGLIQGPIRVFLCYLPINNGFFFSALIYLGRYTQYEKAKTWPSVGLVYLTGRVVLTWTSMS